VAAAALNAGAHIVNDVWALRADPELAGVAARHNTPVILMHNRSNPASVDVKERLGNAYTGSEYENLIADVKRELMDSVGIARRAGILEERIILDPGIGFGKTVDHNLELIRRLDEIRTLGFPILLGPSRKSFIGYTLDLPPDQRVEGTSAAVAVGITRGADIVRVHDVEPIRRVVKMTDAIIRNQRTQVS
jgi:dihydropteroate synthase